MINCARLLLGLFLVLFFYSCEYKDTTIHPAPLPECGDSIITGYTNKVSYFPGEVVDVFLQSSVRLDCGLGFYDVNGQLAFRSKASVFPQTISSAEPWKNGFEFKSNGKIILPTSLASGIYLIENKITIVVKSMAAADVTVVYPSNTINAYTSSGGKSLYSFNSTGAAASSMVSFLRPVDSPAEKEECHECLRWFPSLTNVKINYIADVDLDDFSSVQSKVIVVVGHSEYWTRKARTNFDRFVDEGGHALILSGNTMWWQVRYTDTKDGLICYRKASADPEPSIALKTVRWVDPTLQYPILPSIGEDFNHGGYGLQVDQGWDGLKIVNPSSPLLNGLALIKGDIINLPSKECDGAPIKGWDVYGFPILNNDSLQFAKFELIGFDRGSRAGHETFPTFTVMQKTAASGIIVNVGSIAWCSSVGMGSPDSGEKIKTITKNAVNQLLTGKNVFSY
jgi:hypothetical protein